MAGILLCAAGALLALPSTYVERTFILDAGGCRMETMIAQEPGVKHAGSVVLFHGLSANERIMSYLARGFVDQGFRVYAPDFPGHGRTPGPFTPERAEQCGEAFVRGLLARGVITADHTILAGHSMGGAIAARIASRIPVAGVIAISPAPMRTAHGVWPEMLLFRDPASLPPNSLVISGALEPESMRGNAADLVDGRNDGSATYLEIPKATHVSLIFSAAVVRAAQEWCARVLHTPVPANLPSHLPLIGWLVGFVGILLIAGPFLRELAGKKPAEEGAVAGELVSMQRLFLEFAVGSILIVAILRFWIPLKVIRLFQGDYLASFLLLLGAALCAVHWNSLRPALTTSPRAAITAGLAGIMLLFLVSAWFDLTFYEAWLTIAKWIRFPFLLAAFLPYLVAEETLLGPAQRGKKWRRLGVALALRLIGWGAIMAGVFFAHSGEILMGLLGPYMAIFTILQRSGMDIVREETDSAGATAFFGAILQAGFCLVIFPLT